MEILTIADFSINYRKQYKDYNYPSFEGNCIAKLVAAHWMPHAIIMTYWDTDNGDKLKCALFRDNKYKYICEPKVIENIDTATLSLIRASSGKVYLRKIDVLKEAEYVE